MGSTSWVRGSSGLMQGIPDPGAFTQWGILGILAFVIVVLGVILFRLFVRQTSSMEARDRILMDFVDRHRGETTTAMKEVAGTVSNSYQDLRNTMSRQARALDELLMSTRVLDQIEKMKRAGTPLTQDEVDRVVRSIMHERGRERGDS